MNKVILYIKTVFWLVPMWHMVEQLGAAWLEFQNFFLTHNSSIPQGALLYQKKDILGLVWQLKIFYFYFVDFRK